MNNKNINDEYNGANGGLFLLDNHEDIRDILIQENIVETIENNINQLEIECSEMSNNEPKFLPFFTGVTTVAAFTVAPLVEYFLTGVNPYDITKEISNLGVVNMGILKEAILAASFSVVSLSLDYYNFYLEKRRFFANQDMKNELLLLKQHFEVEKEKLELLKESLSKYTKKLAR